MINYAKINSNFSYLHSIIMYHIIINNKTVQSLENKQIAFANFRSLCRDYTNKPSSIKLMLDDEILHAKSADLQLLDDVDKTSNNDILKLVLSQLNIDIKQLKLKLHNSELSVSNSRIDGWLRNDTNDRKYTAMYNDELYAVLNILLNDNQQSIKSPANIVKARQKLDLTQKQLAEKLGMTPTHRQVARWEAGQAEMPDKKWQILQNFLK